MPMEWSEDPQLAAWVLYVRQRNRANNLSQEKVRELDSLNFTWNEPVGFAVSAPPAASTDAHCDAFGGHV